MYGSELAEAYLRVDKAAHQQETVGDGFAVVFELESFVEDDFQDDASQSEGGVGAEDGEHGDVGLAD